MTLRSRNTILSCLLGIGFLLLLLFALTIIVLNINSKFLSSLVESSQGRYLNLTWNLPANDLYLTLISSGLSLLIGCISTFLILFNFRKVNSPELFFLGVFWFSMIFESFRTFNLLAIQESWPLIISESLAKLYYFGRVLGSLSLLSASFHLAGVKIQHQNSLWISALVIAVAVALYIPFDTSRHVQGLLLGTSQFISVDLLSILIGSLSMINVIKYLYTNGIKQNALLLLSFVMLLAGHEFLGVSANVWNIAVAWILLAASTVLLTRRFIRSYLWY